MSKRAVITGSTRGIGRGLADEMAARGAAVVVTGRSQRTVDQTVAALRERHPAERIHGYACDVADESQVQALWDFAVTRLGGVDVWVNNAGISHRRASLVDLKADEVEAVVATNLLGTLYGCRVAIAGMAAAGSGSVWNVNGFGSDGRTAEGIAVYGATKAAISYLTKALAKEVRGTGVAVCTMSPGIVATDLLVRDYDGQPEAWAKARKIFNILGDEVTTVTPYLAERMLRTPRNGGKVMWLTRRKAFARFATAGVRKRELSLPEQVTS